MVRLVAATILAFTNTSSGRSIVVFMDQKTQETGPGITRRSASATPPPCRRGPRPAEAARAQCRWRPTQGGRFRRGCSIHFRSARQAGSFRPSGAARAGEDTHQPAATTTRSRADMRTLRKELRAKVLVLCRRSRFPSAAQAMPYRSAHASFSCLPDQRRLDRRMAYPEPASTGHASSAAAFVLTSIPT